MTTDNDKDLQRFLDGEHPLSAAYDALPKATPPAQLDEMILNKARNEARRPVRPRWLVPLSVAATVVLGVGLSLRQLERPLQGLSDMNTPAASLEMRADDAASPAPRPAGGRDAQPVPKPSLDELLETQAPQPIRLENATVDVDALRERALADTTGFKPPELARLIPRIDASPAPETNALDAATSPAVNKFGKSVGAQSEPQTAARDAHTQALARHGQAASSDAFFATDARDNAAMAQRKEAPVDEEMVEKRLEQIRQLHENGDTERAQTLFDELIEAWPDYEIPQDFPLQPPDDNPQAPAAR